MLTINNPEEKGISDDIIKTILADLKSVTYYCMSHEIGLKEKTSHIHIFIYAKSTIRFSTVKNRFEIAHIDKAEGTVKQNRDYVFKIGKWKGNEKEDTNLKDTHFEFGIIPEESQGKRNDLKALYHQIKDGKSNYELLEINCDYASKLDTINKIRQTVLEEKFKNTFRQLEVTYIYGKTGAGKTRSIMEQYGYENVFRVINYQHPFDSYQQQDVIIFEEFRSDLKIGSMLTLLDGYPLNLPCRYADKVACYTKIYIISNISLNEQYKNIQTEQPESYNAFIRRINTVKIYTDTNTCKQFTTEEYFNPTSIEDIKGFVHNDILDTEALPFPIEEDIDKQDNN
ncbi:replication protein [Lacrimispora brassicae]